MQKLLLFSILAIFAVHAAAVWQFWYFSSWWIDIPIHILGGAWVALLFLYLSTERFEFFPGGTSIWTKSFCALGFAAIMGIGMEIFEYMIAVILAGQASVAAGGGDPYFDTLLDLFDDLAGGFVAVIAYAWYNVRHNGDTP